MALIALDEARTFVFDRCAPLDAVRTSIDRALGRVIAEDGVATEAMPPFTNTAMDGFAVRASDVAGASDDHPVRLRLVDTIHAGRAPTRAIGPGEAARIMTGAPVPEGADAVVMVEHTTPAGGTEVDILEAVHEGQHLRHVGDDIRPGDVVVSGGSELTPARVGVLAEMGFESVLVHPAPRVGVISTGDELVAGGGALAPGQIRDSNRPSLLALVRASGFEAVDLGLVPDDEHAITAALDGGVARCDAIVTSGGVSMGDVDLVKVILGRLADMRWMQVAIRPAKPFAFGVMEDGDRKVPVFGLPGNPVSSLVSFELFARPALRRMAGFERIDRPRVQAVADEALARRPDGKTHFARVRCTYDEGRYHVRSAGGQGSHQLAAMAAANALAVLPDGDGVAAGDTVDVMLLD